VRVIEHWHREAREAAEFPSLEILKTKLDSPEQPAVEPCSMSKEIGQGDLQRCL